MENKHALTNKIDLQFDRSKIDQDFSIFAIMTDEKYIKKGAELLDDTSGELKAVSIVFDYGRLAWLMVRKTDNVSNVDILRFIEKNEENKGHFSVTQKSAFDIEKDYILLRLFLYSLNMEKNEKFAFNNLTGKLFISGEDWIKSKGKTINALQIDVDWRLNLTISFTTFSRLSELRKYHVDVNGLPRYTWSGKDFMLKRTFGNDIDEDMVYIHAPISGKTKPHMNFYHYYQDKRENTKVYYAYQVLNTLQKRYGDYFKAQPSFSSLEVVNENTLLDDKKYMDNVISRFVGGNALSIRFINQCESEFEYILETMKSELYKILQDGDGVVAEMMIGQRFIPSPNTCYIVLHHNANYYKEKGEVDPYAKLPRDTIPIQSITVEDSKDAIEKGSTNESNNIQAFYKTILKELVIKNDLINKKEITLDDWKKRNFERNWVFGFEQDDVRYMIIVFPDGNFHTYKDEGFSLKPFECKYEEVVKANNILRDSKDKTKSVVVDQNGNVLLISKSGMCIMPKEEILYLDHNLHNKDIINDYFTGAYDTSIYRKGSCSYYSSGIPHGSDASFPNSTNVYNVKVVEGENTIDSLIKTFGVPFVRLESFTVLPYPFKYVREYADMQNKKQTNNKLKS